MTVFATLLFVVECVMIICLIGADLVQDLIGKSDSEVVQVMKANYNVQFDPIVHARQLRNRVDFWHNNSVPSDFHVPTSSKVKCWHCVLFLSISSINNTHIKYCE